MSLCGLWLTTCEVLKCTSGWGSSFPWSILGVISQARPCSSFVGLKALYFTVHKKVLPGAYLLVMYPSVYLGTGRSSRYGSPVDRAGTDLLLSRYSDGGAPSPGPDVCIPMDTAPPYVHTYMNIIVII